MSNKSCVTKRGLKIIFLSILDTFAKLRKVTIRFVLSVRPYGQLGSQCMDFHDIWYSSICRKFVEKIQVSWKSEKNKFYLHEYRYLFLIVFCWILFRLRNIYTKLEKIKTPYFLFRNVFSKIVPFINYCGNLFRTVKDINCNMAHVHCMLDT